MPGTLALLSRKMETVLNVLEWVVGIASFGWFIWWRLQEDEAGPWGFVIKALASLVILYLYVRFGMGWFREGGFAAVMGLGMGMASALALGVVWRDDLIGIVGNFIGGFYEDKTPLEPKPYYAHVEAKRMAGDYAGAVTAVRAELEKFPHDFDGHMRLAALLAEHLKDLPGALGVIEETLQLPALAPNQIAYTLNTAADWHLQFARDTESARLAIERITTLLPGTTAALHAQQRLANFTTPEMLAREDERQPIVMPEFERKLGLKRRKPTAPEKPDINAAERQLRERLTRNPNDWVAREELARLYVEEFEFHERGLQELELLISAPGQPQREVVRWLHQKASWQAKFCNDALAGKATLKRIQELYPNSAAAERAAVAMLHLQPARPVENKKTGE